MQRINSINARLNLNGQNKAGFHDNVDISGHDATYLTPQWCNTIQEELANIVEGFGKNLDINNNAQISQILSSMSERLYVLEHSPQVQDIKIGDVFLTMNTFNNSDEVRAHKGYGFWEHIGNGHALVTKGHDNSRPDWMRNIGNTGGEDAHQLTIEEMPSHSHSYHKAIYSYGHKDGGEDLSRYGKDTGNNNAETAQVGQSQSHNNIQLSLIVGAWRRLPDQAELFELHTDKTIINANDEFQLFLKTQNVVKGKKVDFKIEGLAANSMVPSQTFGHFIVEDNGEAHATVKIKDLNTYFKEEYLKISLTDKPHIVVSVRKNLPAPTYTTILLNNLPVIQKEGEISISDGIDLYDLYVERQGHEPILNEIITFVVPEKVAIIGQNNHSPAILVSEKWTEKNALQIENRGYILGRGAPATHFKSKDQTFIKEEGGLAILNKSNIKLEVKNFATIAGGGGSGEICDTEGNTGAGAPFGFADTPEAQGKFKVGGIGAKRTNTVRKSSAMGTKHKWITTVVAKHGDGGVWGEAGGKGQASHVGDQFLPSNAGQACEGFIEISHNEGTIRP